MKLPLLLVALALPLALGSCGLVNSAIKIPASLIQTGVRAVSENGDTTPPATREAENASAIALEY